MRKCWFEKLIQKVCYINKQKRSWNFYELKNIIIKTCMIRKKKKNRYRKDLTIKEREKTLIKLKMQMNL